MAFPKQVRMVEMSPRDGLQNEPGPVIATRIKTGLIDRLADCGLTHIESASFVSPKWVPQMGDADKVMAGIKRKPGVRYSVLTPTCAVSKTRWQRVSTKSPCSVPPPNRSARKTSTAPSPKAWIASCR